MKKKIYFIVILISICINATAQRKDVLGLTYDRKTTKIKKVPEVTTSFDCMNDGTGSVSIIDMFNKFEKETVNNLGATVSAEEENDFGDKTFEEMKKSGKYKFINHGEKILTLESIMNDLLNCRSKSSGLKYQIHLLDDKTVNAFTMGGHIYITTGIIDYVKTESAIAFVIGHEIAHNEKGHLNLILRKLKFGRQIAGDFGDIGLAIQQMVAPSFNQTNEVEADCFGVDLTLAAGYLPCPGINVWKRMAKNEGDTNAFKNFLRSHPYSEVRYNCLMKHIINNYNKDCEDK